MTSKALEAAERQKLTIDEISQFIAALQMHSRNRAVIAAAVEDMANRGVRGFDESVREAGRSVENVKRIIRAFAQNISEEAGYIGAAKFRLLDENNVDVSFNNAVRAAIEKDLE